MVDLLKWFLIDLVKGGIPVRKAFTGSFHPSGEEWCRGNQADARHEADSAVRLSPYR